MFPFARFLPILPAVVLGAVLLGGAGEARAHGDDRGVIAELTRALAKGPEASLYIRRGELYRHLEEWPKAESDFAEAARLEPGLVSIDFFRARAFFEAGAPGKARTFIDRFISRAPDEPEGWFLRGDVLAALGQHEAGAADYAEGIRRAAEPRPEHFLRRARLLAAAPGADPARVIAAIEEGVERLGPVISLHEFALALELAEENYAAALVRIRAVIERVPRPEAWLVRQADVLVKAGRTDEAASSYRAAIAVMEELPVRYRETPFVDTLIREARASLNRLVAHP